MTKFGATGSFPQGKIAADDEGELRLGITHKDGQVIIHFADPVRWLGMPPSVARQFCDAILNHCDEIEGKKH